MNQFLSNKIIAGIVALALLVGVGVLISSGDTSSTTRNAALVVATPCTKPGQVTKVSKQSVVCATTNTGSLWYATMKATGKAQPCTTPGAIRQKSDIVWVCGVIKKKKLWQATQPLSALAAEGDLPSTTPATPGAPVVADNAVLADPAVIDTAATQTLVPAKPAALSLETQPWGGVNALALETQPVVQLLDQRGASISTAGITITAVSGRTDVVLSGNTAVTDAAGRATFTTLSLTGIMGDIALTFTALRLGLEGVTSGNLVLAAGVATALVSDTQLGAVAAGKPFNQYHKLHLEDSSRNVLAISGRDVVVSSSTEGMSGTTKVPTAPDGYVLFTDLRLTQTGPTTLTFTSGGLSTTSRVTVMPGDSQGLKITTEASEVATNNIAFAQSPVVQLIDAKGNNVTTAGFTVTATITRFAGGAAATNSTLSNAIAITNAQGVATFTGLGITGLIGKYTLGFTPNFGVTQVSGQTVTLQSGEPKKLIVLTAPSSPEGNSTAGIWSLTQSPVIGLRDISNNPVTKNGVTVTATVTGQDPTFSAVTDADGKATIELIFSGNNAGLRTITYKASNVNDLTADITLPRLISVVTRAWTVPAKSITSRAFSLTAPTSNSNGAWTFTSSASTIATVSTAGIVTIKGLAGTVTITATQLATPKYESATTTAELDVARYSVGDVGPGGGTVFYVAATQQSWGRYLEAALTDYQVDGSRARLPLCEGIFTGATATAIGTGKANTSAILETCAHKPYGIAADVANRYSTSTAGAGQWFLPSKDELNELCKIYSNGRTDTTAYSAYQNGCTGSTTPTGGFAAGYYWSSSGNFAGFAWRQDFGSGDLRNTFKSSYFYVRPVRAF